LAESKSLDTTLDLIMDEAVRLTDASSAIVNLLEEDGNKYRVWAFKGIEVPELSDELLRIEDSLVGQVIEKGEPATSHDTQNDPRVFKERARLLDVVTTAIAPLKIRDKTLGSIGVHNKRNGCFDDSDVSVLCSLANLAAMAINNAQLIDEISRISDEKNKTAQELQELLIRTMRIEEEERRRIAADVHDRVVPLIVGALYEVEASIESYERSEEISKQLQMLKELLNRAIEETREAVYNLRPATLDHIGLLPALRQLLTYDEKIYGIPHSLRVHGTLYWIGPTARITTYRIIQEALHNIHEHANATAVDVLVRFSPQGLRLTIRDDGIGFDLNDVLRSPTRRSLGLLGMRERALSIGADLQVSSQPGMGTQVALDIPANRMEPDREV
jgi:two-component system sensor histidine kinase DegS